MRHLRRFKISPHPAHLRRNFSSTRRILNFIRAFLNRHGSFFSPKINLNFTDESRCILYARNRASVGYINLDQIEKAKTLWRCIQMAYRKSTEVKNVSWVNFRVAYTHFKRYHFHIHLYVYHFHSTQSFLA